MALLGCFPLIAAAPVSRGFSIDAPRPTYIVPRVRLGEAAPPSRFAPAPLPNRDAARPTGPRASRAASLAPGMFTRSDQYHGEGLSVASSAQSDQEKRVKPGAGFNLRMPLQ